MTTPNFSGVTAEYYLRFRRGYPDVVVDRLVGVLDLGPGAKVLDLGCGSGQLTIPLARRAAAVIGADPEPDMLRLGREAGLAVSVDNVAWMLAADSDLDALGALIGDASLSAVTIGTAFHWMDCASLFARLGTLLVPGGRVAVITNGLTNDWEYDLPWSRVLRECLENEFGAPLRATTGTDADSQRAVAEALTNAGFTVLAEVVVDYVEQRTVAHLIGSLYSTMKPSTVERLRAGRFENDLTNALATVRPDGQLTATVQVPILTAATSRVA